MNSMVFAAGVGDRWKVRYLNVSISIGSLKFFFYDII